jgi:uncharacterized membrane protein
MKRKKRAKKSIESIDKRINEHGIKLENARKEKKIELIDYYKSEIEDLEAYRDKKKRILER